MKNVISRPFRALLVRQPQKEIFPNNPALSLTTSNETLILYKKSEDSNKRIPDKEAKVNGFFIGTSVRGTNKLSTKFYNAYRLNYMLEIWKSTLDSPKLWALFQCSKNTFFSQKIIFKLTFNLHATGTC